MYFQRLELYFWTIWGLLAKNTKIKPLNSSSMAGRFWENKTKNCETEGSETEGENSTLRENRETDGEKPSLKMDLETESEAEGLDLLYRFWRRDGWNTKNPTLIGCAM